MVEFFVSVIVIGVAAFGIYVLNKREKANRPTPTTNGGGSDDDGSQEQD